MITKLKSFIFTDLVFIENPATFKPDDDLFQAGLDSMSIMRLVMFIEDNFGICLPDDELAPENLQTLNRLMAWIERHQNKPG